MSSLDDIFDYDEPGWEEDIITEISFGKNQNNQDLKTSKGKNRITKTSSKKSQEPKGKSKIHPPKKTQKQGKTRKPGAFPGLPPLEELDFYGEIENPPTNLFPDTTTTGNQLQTQEGTTSKKLRGETEKLVKKILLWGDNNLQGQLNSSTRTGEKQQGEGWFNFTGFKLGEEYSTSTTTTSTTSNLQTKTSLGGNQQSPNTNSLTGTIQTSTGKRQKDTQSPERKYLTRSSNKTPVTQYVDYAKYAYEGVGLVSLSKFDPQETKEEKALQLKDTIASFGAVKVEQLASSKAILHPDLPKMPEVSLSQFPWVLYHLDQVEQFQGTPMDFILHSVVQQFQELLSSKITEVLQHGGDHQFGVASCFSTTALKAGEFLYALKVLSKYFLTIVVSKMLQWRTSMMSTLSANIPHESPAPVSAVHALPVVGKFVFKKPNPGDSDDGDSSRQHLLFSREGVAIDYVFLTVVITLLESTLTPACSPSFPTQQLDQKGFIHPKKIFEQLLHSKVAEELEQISFDSLKAASEMNKKEKDPIVIENRKLVLNLHAQLLGIFSRYQFSSIAYRFLSQIDLSSQGKRLKTAPFLDAMQFLELDFIDDDGVQITNSFVKQWLNLLEEKDAKKELELKLSSQLAAIMKNSALKQLKPHGWETKQIHFYEWKQHCESFFNRITKFKKKDPKTMVRKYPLFTMHLCMTSTVFFMKFIWSFISDHLYRLYKEKEKESSVALDLICTLIKVYFIKVPWKNPEDNLIDLDKNLASVLEHLYPASPKKPFASKSSQAQYVDLLVFLANHRLDLVFSKVLFPLMKNLENVTQCPDKHMVALQALFLIHQNIDKRLLKPFEKDWCSLIFDIGERLNELFGKDQFLSCFNTKDLTDIIPKQPGPIGLDLLAILIDAIPLLFPSSCLDKYPSKSLFLLYNIVRYSVHLDKNIRSRATTVLDVLMTERPSWRTHLVSFFSKFLITIPDKKYETLMYFIMEYKRILQRWEEERTGTKHGAKHPQKQSFLSNDALENTEAGLVIFFCCPEDQMKKLILEILKLLRSIATTFLKQPRSFFIGILEESGPTILMRIKKEVATGTVRTMIEQSCKLKEVQLLELMKRFMLTQNLMDFCSNTSDNFICQLGWCLCLAEVVKIGCTLIPRTVARAWDFLISRYNMISPSENDPKKDGLSPTEVAMYANWWRNYLVFACSGLPAQNPRPKSELFSKVSKLMDDCVKHLKNPTDPLATTVTLALTRCSQKIGVYTLSTLDILFHALKPLERESYFQKRPKDKKINKKDRIRVSVGYIYSSVIEAMEQKTLVVNPLIRRYYRDWVVETMTYLQHPELDFFHELTHYLRLYFCVIVERLASNLSTSTEEHLGTDFRETLFIFLLKWSSLRTKSFLEDETLKKLYDSSEAQIKDKKKKEEYRMAMEDRFLHLSLLADQAMAPLLVGKPPGISKFNPSSVFEWINGLLTAGLTPGSLDQIDDSEPQAIPQDKQVHNKHKYTKSLRLIGKHGIECFLSRNHTNDKIMGVVINECYSKVHEIRKGYFLALVQLFKKYGSFPYKLPEIINLIIFKTGDISKKVRLEAIELLRHIATLEHSWKPIIFNTFGLKSTLPDIYTNVQLQLSLRLGNEHGTELANPLFREVVKRLEILNGQHIKQKQVLMYTVPWVNRMSFEDCPATDDLLTDFLVVTYKYIGKHPEVLKDLWSSVGEVCVANTSGRNMSPIINFLLRIGVQKKTLEFINLAKKILVILGKVVPTELVESLKNELSSKTVNSASTTRPIPIHCFETLNTLMPDTSKTYHPPARGHLALVFLSDLTFEKGELSTFMRAHLHTFLHQILLFSDHSNPFVREQCRKLLLNLVQSLVVTGLEATKGAPEPFENEADDEAIELRNYLVQQSDSPGMDSGDQSFANSEQVVKYVRRVVRVFQKDTGRFEATRPLTHEWADEASQWAVNCPKENYHLILRSYQIFRALAPYISRETQPTKQSQIQATFAPKEESSPLLRRVINAAINSLFTALEGIESVNDFNYGLAIEILLGVETVAEHLNPKKLILFSDLFWAAVAILNAADFEVLYSHAVRILRKMIVKLDWNDGVVVNMFKNSIPKNWNPPFVGVQPLLLKGYFHGSTHYETESLLAVLPGGKCPDIFQKDRSRVITRVMVLLPRLCAHLPETLPEEAKPVSRNLPSTPEREIALRLGKYCEREKFSDLGKFLCTFPNFSIQKLCHLISRIFLPEFEGFVLSFLFTTLERLPRYRHTSLLIVKYILKWQTSLPKQLLCHTSSWVKVLLQYLINGSRKERYEVTALVQLFMQNAEVTPDRDIPLPSGKYKIEPIFSNVPAQGSQKMLTYLTQEKEKASSIAATYFSKFFVRLENLSDSYPSPQNTFNSTGSIEEIYSGGTKLGSNNSTPDIPPKPTGPGSWNSQLPERFNSQSPQNTFKTSSLGNSNHSSGSKRNLGHFGYPSFSGFDEFMKEIENISKENEETSPGPLPPPGGDILQTRPDQDLGPHIDSQETTEKSTLTEQSSSPRTELPQQQLLGDSLDVSLSPKNNPIDLTRWKEVLSKEPNPKAESTFEIFPVAQNYISILSLDYKDLYPELISHIITPRVKAIFSDGAFSLGEISPSDLTGPVPSINMVGVVFSKFKEIVAQQGPTRERRFLDSRANSVNILQGLLHQYPTILEGTYQSKLEYLQEKSKGDKKLLLEIQYSLSILQLHATLVRINEANIVLQSLASEILTGSSRAPTSFLSLDDSSRGVWDDKSLGRVLAKMGKQNQQAATELKGYEEEIFERMLSTLSLE